MIWLLALSVACLPSPAIADRDGDGYDATVDCDDRNPAVHPGATEICNGIDDDCDGDVDGDVRDNAQDAPTWYADADADGYGDPNLAIVACTAPTADGYPWVGDDTDCDDSTPLINPGMNEICGNDVDDNCDGVTTDCP